MWMYHNSSRQGGFRNVLFEVSDVWIHMNLVLGFPVSMRGGH